MMELGASVDERGLSMTSEAVLGVERSLRMETESWGEAGEA
jgi:hypothetical protein